MTRDMREVLIGAAALAVLGLVMAYLYGGREAAARATSGLTVDAVFNRVDGLVKGDEVYLSGIPVGRVDAMRLDDAYRAVVTLRINADVDLPNDSTAAIHTDGLFGSKFVVIDPGSEEQAFKTGDRITFTDDAVVVSDLLDLIISEGRANQAAAAKEKKQQ